MNGYRKNDDTYKHQRTDDRDLKIICEEAAKVPDMGKYRGRVTFTIVYFFFRETT